MFSAAVDFWSIAVDDTIGTLSITQLLDNAQYFPDRITRNGAGTITLLDLTAANIGSRRTQGIEVTLRGGFDVPGGQLLAGLDGTYLVKKKEKLLPNAPYGESLIGKFTFAGDLGLRWKHNAFMTYSTNSSTSASARSSARGTRTTPCQALPTVRLPVLTTTNLSMTISSTI